MKTHLIQIAGNIGTGKTTLAELLGQRLGWEPILESLDGNPFFGKFYSDMSRWSFHQQVAFLVADLRLHQQQISHLLNTNKEAVVQDWMFEMHYDIFASALISSGNMSNDEGFVYKELCERVQKSIAQPTHIIYLNYSPSTALKRILNRNRSGESSITLEYLELIDALYKKLFSEYIACPVLTIEDEAIDFQSEEQGKIEVVEEITRFVRSEH